MSIPKLLDLRYNDASKDICNPNLLDNPFFTINQRGATSYKSGYSYTVDRWKIESSTGSLSVSSNGIVFSGELRQYFEPYRFNGLWGKKVTVSIMYMDGAIKSKTYTLPSAMPSAYVSWGGTGTAAYTFQLRVKDANTLYISIIGEGNSNGIMALKIEAGEISTIANEGAPNYELELIKCRASTADTSDTYANNCIVSKVNSINTSLSTLSSTVSSHTTSINTNASNISTLNTNVNGANSKLNSL